MIRIVASDLDETLLNSDKQVDPYTIEMIKKIKEKGTLFVCATGRPAFSLQNTLKQIDQYQKEGTYTIGLNGAVVTENKGNKVLYTEGVDFDLAQAIYKNGLNYDVCIHVYTTDAVYAYNLNENEIDFLKGRMEVIPIDHRDLDFLKDQQIIKLLYQNTDFEYLKSIEESLPEWIKDACDLSYSSSRYFEFNKKGVHKGLGLRYLCNLLNIPIEDSMAIGDNFNDVGMLKEAGFSVGVKNINKAIQDCVDYISPYTHNEGAVGHILEEKVLKEQF